ncbi:MAG: lipoprotein signal peptidase [Epsilonproteobacteria bacterium]|nr:lipoprotein signal peptidase [Campylobacterota bacterium]
MHNPTLRLSVILVLTTVGIFIIDQNIKMLFVDGFRYYSNYMDLILVYNKGVAFSMLSFLDEWLKYIQLIVVSGVLIYIINLKKVCYALPAGLMLGGAFSNIYDRFVHGGVVDMFYWHGWPYPIAGQAGFAVFNFADVMIDLAVVMFLFLNFKPKMCKS